MKDTDHDRDHEDQAPAGRPAWVDGDGQGADPGMPPARRQRQRVPVAGSHAEDGLWEHVLVVGCIAALLTWIAAVAIPASVPLWMIGSVAAVLSMATWFTALNLTASMPVAAYLGAWGIVLTGWIIAARLAGPWTGEVIFALVLPVLALIPAGVTVIRRHRDRVRRAALAGRDTANIRECRYWEGLLQRYGVIGTAVRDVIRVEGGYQVHCRLGKFTAEGRRPTGIEGIRELAGPIAQHKRLAKGSVYIEEEPAGGSHADFIIHVRSVTGPRLARYLPAENKLLTVNRPFSLGVLDTGREFLMTLREVVVFICGVRGSGKSNLLNVFIAQLCRMPDALIFMIDLKGGQEARAWLMPWILGHTDRPPIDWLVTTREEAKAMLDALWAGGTARAESGKYGRKLRPGVQKDGEMAPAVVVICDETAVMTGHFLREDNLSNTALATRLLQIAETFRSVAIDPVVAAVRAVVDVTGNSGIKAMSEVRIGMRVATADEGRAIFPDNFSAAKQLSMLKDRGSGIVKVGAELHPPVHFYHITDGEPDDDGHPTEDRITPIVLSTADRRPAPEQLFRDAMGEAYAKRWEQPHIKALIDKWRQEAGVAPPLPGPPRPAGSWPRITPAGGDDATLADMIRHDPLLSELDGGPGDDDEPGRLLNPVRKRMYQLLIGRGAEGYRVGILWTQLLNEGLTVTRQTVHDWLAQAEKTGYVYRTGKPRSRWMWRLPEGAEFDIPGWD